MTAFDYMHVDIFFISILLLLLPSYYRHLERSTPIWHYRNLVITEIITLICDGFCRFIRGVRISMTLLQVMLVVTYIAQCFVILCCSLFLLSYLRKYYGSEKHYSPILFDIILAFNIINWIASYFSGAYWVITPDFEVLYKPLFVMLLLGCFLFLIPAYVEILKYRKKLGWRRTMFFFSYVLFPSLSMIPLIFFGLNLAYPSVALSVLVIHMQLRSYYDRKLAENTLASSDIESQLQEAKQKILMGRIQPYFIQSVLSTIADLVMKDPKEAEETIGVFASYLRMNLNSLDRNVPVLFEEELKHVKAYMFLVGKRWSDGMIGTEYDIRDAEFTIPVLTLQPLFENAVNHGLLPCGGGTVTLRTYHGETGHVVEIEDDGKGFDPTLGTAGTGIESTRNRIAILLGGSLEVLSSPGKGCLVRITIPFAAPAGGGGLDGNAERPGEKEADAVLWNQEGR